MGRNKNYDRTEVIEIAMETFWLKGYSSTSLSDLTEHTGLNKKSLYNEFGSKEELFNIALDHYNQKRGSQVELLRREPLGFQNIIDFFKKLANDTDKRGCLLALSINERELLEKDATKSVRDSFQGLKKLIELNLPHTSDKERENSKALALFLSSQMFSIAGLGKLKVDKKEILKSVEVLLKSLEG